MKRVLDNLGKIVTAGAIVGSGFLNQGCETMSPGDAAALSYIAGVAGTPRAGDSDLDKIANFGLQAASAGLSAESQRGISRAGASNVNVNVYGEIAGQSQNYSIGYPPSKAFVNAVANDKIRFFTCNWVNDVNGNRGYDCDEFFGVKNYFRNGEPLTVVGIFNINRGQRLDIKVFDQRGELAYSVGETIPLRGKNFVLPLPNMETKLSPGNYIYHFLIDGRQIGGNSFIIGDR